MRTIACRQGGGGGMLEVPPSAARVTTIAAGWEPWASRQGAAAPSQAVKAAVRSRHERMMGEGGGDVAP